MGTIEDLETRVAVLERRVEELDHAPVGFATTVRRTPPRPAGAAPPPLLATAHVAAPRHAREAAPRDEGPAAAGLEELLGGRVLAWVGAIAVVTGLFLLLVVAVRHGWIGEAQRTLMAGLASLALLAAGLRLHERHGRTEASLAAAAAGIAGLFGTLTVAGPCTT